MPTLHADTDIDQAGRKSGSGLTADSTLRQNDLLSSSTSDSRVASFSGMTTLPPRDVQLPQWAILSSAVWLIIAVTYLLTVALSGFSPAWTPVNISGVLAGFSAPLVIIWLIAILQMRSMEIDAVTLPVRRHLNALLLSGGGAENRVKRVMDMLGAQTEQLRQAANIALEDSSAAMTALTRQSADLRKLSAEALTEIAKVTKGAEQTIKSLHDALAQLNSQSGAERERTLALVTELEKHTREVLGQVDELTGKYESKLSHLNETAGQIEGRARSIVSLTDELDTNLETAASSTLRDLDRLEGVVAELGQRSAAIAHQINRPVESLERAADQLDQNMRQSQEILNSATYSLEKVGATALTRSENLVDILSDRVSNMELIGAKLISVGTSAQSESGRHVAELEKILQRLNQDTVRGEQSIRDAIAAFDQSAASAVESSEGIAEKLFAGARNFETSYTKGAEHFDVIIKNFDDQVNRLNDSSTNAQQRFITVQTDLTAAQDRLSAQLQTFEKANAFFNDFIEQTVKNTQLLHAASLSAQKEASHLLQSGDQTRASIEAMAEKLIEQQATVQVLSTTVGEQVQSLTDTLKTQQHVLQAAAAQSGEQGDVMRKNLQTQVESMGLAGLEIEEKLQAVYQKIKRESDAFEQHVLKLEENIKGSSHEISQQNDTISQLHKAFVQNHEELAELSQANTSQLNAILVQFSNNREKSEQTLTDLEARITHLTEEVLKAGHLLRHDATKTTEAQAAIARDSEHAHMKVEGLLQQLRDLVTGLSTAEKALVDQEQTATLVFDAAQEKAEQASQKFTTQQQNIVAGIDSYTHAVEQGCLLLRDEQAQITTLSHNLSEQHLDYAQIVENSVKSLSDATRHLEQISGEGRMHLASAEGDIERASTLLQTESRSSIAAIEMIENALTQATSLTQEKTESSRLSVMALQDDLQNFTLHLVDVMDESRRLAATLENHNQQTQKSGENIATLTQQLGESSSSSQEYIQKLTQVTRLQSEATDELLQRITSSDEALRTALRHYEDAGATIESHTDHVQSVLKDVAIQLRENAHECITKLDQASQHLDGLGDVFSETGRVIDTKLNAFDTQISALDQTSAEVSESLTRRQTEIETSIEKLATSLDHVVTKIDLLGQKTLENDEKLSMFSLTLDHKSEEFGKIHSAALTSHAALINKVDETVSTYTGWQSALKGVEDQLSSSADYFKIQLDRSYDDLKEKSTHSAEVFDETLSKVTKLTEKLTHSTDAHQATMGVFSSTIQQLSDEIDSLHNRIDESLTRISRQSDFSKEQWNDSVRQLSDLSSSIEKTGVSVQQHYSALQQAGHLTDSQFKTLSESLALHLDKVAALTSSFKNQETGLQDSIQSLHSEIDDTYVRYRQLTREIETVCNDNTQKLATSNDLFQESINNISRTTDIFEDRLKTAAQYVADKSVDLSQHNTNTLSELNGIILKMNEVMGASADSQRTLEEHVQTNERMVKGLSEISLVTSETLDTTVQKMAILAQQVVSDREKMADVSEKIEKQQTSLHQAAQSMMDLMRMVETQIKKSGASTVDMIESSEGRMSAAAQSLAHHFIKLYEQNEQLYTQIKTFSADFITASDALRLSGQEVGSELQSMSQNLHLHALDLTASGQQFDRELSNRLSNIETTHNNIDQYFSVFNRHLAELDTRTNSYLIDMNKRSEEGFHRLQQGVDALEVLPKRIHEAQNLLQEQLDHARQQLSVLQDELAEVGHHVKNALQEATQDSSTFMAKLRENGEAGRLAAHELIDISTTLGGHAEKLWSTVRDAAKHGTGDLETLVDRLDVVDGEGLARVETLRDELNLLVETIEKLSTEVNISLEGVTERTFSLAQNSSNIFDQLKKDMADGADKIEQTTAYAKDNFTSAVAMLVNHQNGIELTSEKLSQQMFSLKTQLTQLMDGLNGVDSRIGHVEPILDMQHAKLSAFLSSLDHTLGQLTSLQIQTQSLAQEHMALSNQVQIQEDRLLLTASTLEGRVSHIDELMSAGVYDRLQHAVDHASILEKSLSDVREKSEEMDVILNKLDNRVRSEVNALKTAETDLAKTSDRSVAALLDVGTALSATLSQLQKGGHLTQQELQKTELETKALVSNLSCMKENVQQLLSGVSGDLNAWQTRMSDQLNMLQEQLSRTQEESKKSEQRLSLPMSVHPQVSSDHEMIPSRLRTLLPPRIKDSIVPPPSAMSERAMNSSQLAAESLNAVAVDLYRLLYAESPILRRDMKQPLSRLKPMSREDARTYTRTILELKRDVMRTIMPEFYAKNAEFKQYVDRFMMRYEQHYATLAKDQSGSTIAAAVMWKAGELGQLYTLFVDVLDKVDRTKIERKAENQESPHSKNAQSAS